MVPLPWHKSVSHHSLLPRCSLRSPSREAAGWVGGGGCGGKFLCRLGLSRLQASFLPYFLRPQVPGEERPLSGSLLAYDPGRGCPTCAQLLALFSAILQAPYCPGPEAPNTSTGSTPRRQKWLTLALSSSLSFVACDLAPHPSLSKAAPRSISVGK